MTSPSETTPDLNELRSNAERILTEEVERLRAQSEHMAEENKRLREVAEAARMGLQRIASPRFGDGLDEGGSRMDFARRNIRRMTPHRISATSLEDTSPEET